MTLLKLGIIGAPLTHTLSPLLHGHLLQGLNLSGEYKKYELSSDQLGKGLETFSKQGLRGLNVTIPHKVAVMNLMDWLSPEAQLAGAVNTVVFEQDGAYKRGHNTDIQGFIQGLPPLFVERLPESHILVLGAGGSARAVMTGLIQLKTAGITVAIRNPARAISLLGNAETIKQTYKADTRILTLPLGALSSLADFNGVINTTPVGMWPDIQQSPLSLAQLETLRPEALVYDLIYRPTETDLLQTAKRLGLPTVNGLEMLIRQGITSFELWQEKPVPDTLMAQVRRELASALEERNAQQG